MTSQPMKPPPMTTALVRALGAPAKLERVVDRAQRERAVELTRPGAGGDHDRVRFHVVERQIRSPSFSSTSCSAYQRNRVDECVLRGGLAAEQPLRERWAVIGAVRILRPDDDLVAASGLAVALHQLRGCEATSDDRDHPAPFFVVSLSSDLSSSSSTSRVQPAGGPLDDLDVAHLLGGERAGVPVGEQLEEPRHRGERRSQLVADHGDELVPGPLSLVLLGDLPQRPDAPELVIERRHVQGERPACRRILELEPLGRLTQTLDGCGEGIRLRRSVGELEQAVRRTPRTRPRPIASASNANGRFARNGSPSAPVTRIPSTVASSTFWRRSSGVAERTLSILSLSWPF